MGYRTTCHLTGYPARKETNLALDPVNGDDCQNPFSRDKCIRSKVYGGVLKRDAGGKFITQRVADIWNCGGIWYHHYV